MERTIIGEVCNLSGVEWFAEPIRYFSHLQRKVHVSIFLCLLAFCAYPCLPPIYDSAEKKQIKMLCLQWKIHGPFSSVQELDSDANFFFFFFVTLFIVYRWLLSPFLPQHCDQDQQVKFTSSTRVPGS